MNSKKIIKDFVISIFILSFVGGTYAVWTGLIAEEGDILDVSKWNELVNKVTVLEEKVTVLEEESTSVLQSHVFSDYSRSSTPSGGYYYFGGTEFLNSITPKKSNSIIQISINYFGESNSHDVHTLLQYSINGGSWTNFDRVGNGQAGTMKLGAYPDLDYNSTPHNHSTQVAKQFNTTETISFRMYHFNGGTFWHNGSVSTTYESGPSTLVLKELNASNSSYIKN